eukprot:5918577-Lingulodinium_polyedra.AAC.1
MRITELDARVVALEVAVHEKDARIEALVGGQKKLAVAAEARHAEIVGQLTSSFRGVNQKK